MGAERHKVSSDEVHQLMMRSRRCRIELKNSPLEGRCCAKIGPFWVPLVFE